MAYAPAKHHAGPLLFALDGAGIGERALRTEGAVHEVDARDVLAEFGEVAHANLNGLHRHEYGLLVLAEEELATTTAFNRRVEPFVQPSRCSHDGEAVLQRGVAGARDEDGGVGCLARSSRDEPAGAEPCERLGDRA